MNHSTELELIEDHYVPDPDVAAHARECPSCGERRLRVSRALEQSRDEFERRVASKPEGFWTAQREAIRQRTRASHSRGSNRSEILRWAMAAGLLVLVGGGFWVDALRDRSGPSQTIATATGIESGDPVVIPLPTADPWASEELTGWEDAVAWESWLEPERQGGGAS